MGSKKHNKPTSSGNFQTLKIGSRIRCTDDGVEGRITWANGVSVKVKWDDGEQVTWKRDSLTTRPIEILGADDEGDQTVAPAATDAPEGTSMATEAEQPVAPADAPATEPTTTPELAQAESQTTNPTADQVQAEPEITIAPPEQPQAEPENTPTEQPATDLATTPTETTASDPATTPTETTGSALVTVSEATAGPIAPSSTSEAAPPTVTRKTPSESKEKKLSALDAAAKVLAEAGQPLNAQEMIAAMAEKGYWTSPGGKTPAATIYAAIISEIKKKGADARFVKTERGKFARKA